MAAPTSPVSPWPGVGFWEGLISAIIAASNLSIPDAANVANTGVLSGASATVIIAALQKQLDLT